MKIAIQTFWGSEDNYGQILQCFALQKWLCGLGHEAYLIRYDPKNDYHIENEYNVIKRKLATIVNPLRLYYAVLWRVLKLVNKKDRRQFDEFKKRYIKCTEVIYHSYKELVNNPPVADVYIVGSDQVWSFCRYQINHVREAMYAYLLNFGEESVKRISYAASFGCDSINRSFINEMKPLLTKFDFISVRELSGLAICRQCGVDNAKWLPDPTLLLNGNIYRALYSDSITIKQNEKYCFLYMVESYSNFPINIIYRWAKKQNLKIIYVTANMLKDRYKKVYATIPEWLYLIDNAEYVITNSFHGMVFSIIFEKKFGVVLKKNEHSCLNDRIFSLFKLLKMEERVIENNIDIIKNDIDWTDIKNKFVKIQLENSSSIEKVLTGARL